MYTRMKRALPILLALLCLTLPARAVDGALLTPPENPGDLVLWIQSWEALIGSFGDNYTQPGNLQYEHINDDTAVMVTGVVNGQDLDGLAVPAVLDGLPVTTIGAGAFAGQEFRFAVLPNTVTAIGEGAFTGCNQMHTLSVPFVGASETSAGVLGYLGVSDDLLQLFVTNASVIGAGAFAGRSHLKAIVFAGDKPVTMGERAFAGCTGLEALTLPKGLQSVGAGAFQNCTNFTSFTVPDSVQTIGEGAFAGCSNLQSVTLPFIGGARGNSGESAAHFGYIFGRGSAPGEAYQSVLQCRDYSNVLSYYLPSGLTSVTITDETVVGYGAFQNCSMLTDVSLPLDTVTRIDARAFAGCTKLTALSIPDAVTTIPYETFAGCTALAEQPTIPAAVKTIETNAFLNCTGFTALAVPDTVEVIESEAFAGCANLESVTLPFIGRERGNTGEFDANFGYVFGRGGANSEAYCAVIQNKDGSNSATYYLPAGLTAVTITDESVIGYGAFQNCAQLTSLTYPAERITALHERAFANCKRLGVDDMPMPPKVDTIPSYCFSGCTGLPADYTVPATVKTIQSYAFLDCTSIQRLTVPDAVESIEAQAFAGCSGLQSVTLPFIGRERGNTGEFDANFGYVFGCGGANSEAYCAVIQNKDGSNSATYYLPAGLTAVTITDESVIGYGAFQNCAQLTSLAYPTASGTVQSVGGRAFAGCTELAALPIPEDVTVLPSEVFKGCTALTVQPTIPAAVKTIETNAFLDCTGLTALVIPDTVQSIGYLAFAGCANLQSVTLPFIGAKRGNTGEFDANFGYVFGRGGANSEAYCAVIQNKDGSNSATYYLPAGLTAVTITDESVIGYGAFQNCAQLTSLSYPAERITALHERAFANCKRLGVDDMPMPPKVDTIPSYCFSGCTGLPADYTVPATVKTIQSYAFLDCTSIQRLTVPDAVETIEAQAFAGCSGLQSVTLPFIGRERGNTGTFDANFGCIFGRGNAGSEAYRAVIQNKDDTNPATYYLPAGLTAVTITDESVIGYGAFQNCAQLTSLAYPTASGTVQSVGGRAFAGCTGLAALPIPEDVTVLPSEVFKGCTALTVQPTIPAAVKTIETNAFLDCTGLTALVIPDTVQSIGYLAFAGCANLESVTLPFIGAKRGNTGEFDANFGYVFGQGNAGSAKYRSVVQHKDAANPTTYQIPVSLTRATITDELLIGYGAFENCDGIIDYAVSKPSLYGVGTNGGQATLADVVAAGGMDVTVTLDRETAAKQPTLYAVIYDTEGRLVYVGAWSVTDADVTVKQRLGLPQDVEIGRIQTMLLDGAATPLTGAYRLEADKE